MNAEIMCTSEISREITAAYGSVMNRQCVVGLKNLMKVEQMF